MFHSDQHITLSNLIKSFLLTFGMLLVSVSAYAEFNQFDANYKARFDKFKAKSSMSLRQDPVTGEYTYSTYTKPKGLARLFGKITESLKFTLDGQNIIPNSYRHYGRDNVSIDYDWGNQKAKIEQQREGSSRRTIMWFADELDFVLIKMQQFKDNKVRASLYMTSYKSLGFGKTVAKPSETLTFPASTQEITPKNNILDAAPEPEAAEPEPEQKQLLPEEDILL